VIDIGVNLADHVFDDDRADVLGRARAAGVTALIATGTSVASSRRSLALARSSPDAPHVFTTAGVHPHQAADVEAGWKAEISTIAQAAEVVAVGETGLDYFRDFSPRPAQRAVFREQIELAVEVGKPLFVHDRDSNGDTRRILADHRAELAGCVIHCFTGTADDLDAYLGDGYHIGVTGWICDERRGGGLRDLVGRIPLDRLLIETDAPYLLPRTIAPRPRSRRNEPAFLGWVARQIAECRGEDPSLVERRTHENALRLFGLPNRR